MPILDYSSLGSASLFLRGRPYISIDSNSAVNSANVNKYLYFGGIYERVHYYIGATGQQTTVTTNNVYVKDGGVWKQCVSVHIKVGGVYRRLENDKIYTKVGTSWKS